MSQFVNEKPRILCVGSNLESQIALNGLINIKANIVGLVTRPVGEPGNITDYVDLHEVCKENNIVTIDTKNINSANTLDHIRDLKPDYIFTLGWSQLFKKELLSIPKEFVIGSHPSILPYGRGRAPVPWTIIEDIRKSAVSFFKMDMGADTGVLLHQVFFDIPARSYAYDVYMLVANSLSLGFCEIYSKIVDNYLKEISFPNIKVSHRAKRGPEDGLINFNQESEEVDKLIRAVSYPYPGAFTFYENKKILVWKSSLDNIPIYNAIPGQILELKDDSILVFAKESAIWLCELTDSLGNHIITKNFKIGTKFGYSVENEIYKIWQELDKLKRLNNE